MITVPAGTVIAGDYPIEQCVDTVRCARLEVLSDHWLWVWPASYSRCGRKTVKGALVMSSRSRCILTASWPKKSFYSLTPPPSGKLRAGEA